MKETYYFSHDYNARNDRKLQRLIMTKGMCGLGVYWCLVEMLFEEGGFLLQTEYDRIAFELRQEVNCIKFVIEESGLFEISDGKFYSNSVLKRIEKRLQLSGIARENVRKRWVKYGGNTAVLQNNENGNTIKERKGKEIKGKGRVKKNKFIQPTLDEVIEYFKINGYSTFAANKAFKYYETGNWIDSKGNRVINWKQKMQAVWFKDENKVNTNEKKKYISSQPGANDIFLTDEEYEAHQNKSLYKPAK